MYKCWRTEREHKSRGKKRPPYRMGAAPRRQAGTGLTHPDTCSTPNTDLLRASILHHYRRRGHNSGRRDANRCDRDRWGSEQNKRRNNTRHYHLGRKDAWDHDIRCHNNIRTTRPNITCYTQSQKSRAQSQNGSHSKTSFPSSPIIPQPERETSPMVGSVAIQGR
jgi:hypothetical protein